MNGIVKRKLLNKIRSTYYEIISTNGCNQDAINLIGLSTTRDPGPSKKNK
jgi:hypothetical protein